MFRIILLMLLAVANASKASVDARIKKHVEGINAKTAVKFKVTGSTAADLLPSEYWNIRRAKTC